MPKRLRVTRVQLLVEAFVDDGDNLTPLPTDPLTVPFSQWATFDLDQALAALRAQVEGPPQDAPDTAK